MISPRGVVEFDVINKKTNQVEQTYKFNNTITTLWMERIGAFIAGVGGITAEHIQPYEIIGFSNRNANYNVVSGLTSSISGVTSNIALSGDIYFDNGSLDISYLGLGSVLYKGDFSPGEDGNETVYSIRSFRLCAVAGNTDVGKWTSDIYFPCAILSIGDTSNASNFINNSLVDENFTIKISSYQLLSVRWTINFIPGQTSINTGTIQPSGDTSGGESSDSGNESTGGGGTNNGNSGSTGGSTGSGIISKPLSPEEIYKRNLKTGAR